MSQKSSQLNPQAKPFTPRASSSTAAAPQTPPRSATAAKKQDQATPMTKAARAAMEAATATTAVTTWTHRGQQVQKHPQQWNVDTIRALKKAAAQQAKQPAPLAQAAVAQHGQKQRGGAATLKITAPTTPAQPQQQQFGTPHSRQYGTPRQRLSPQQHDV